MTSQDLSPLYSSINTPTLIYYDVDVKARTSTCWQCHVTVLYSHDLTMLREKHLPREGYCNECFLFENFKAMNGKFLNSIADTS